MKMWFQSSPWLPWKIFFILRRVSNCKLHSAFHCFHINMSHLVLNWECCLGSCRNFRRWGLAWGSDLWEVSLASYSPAWLPPAPLFPLSPLRCKQADTLCLGWLLSFLPRHQVQPVSHIKASSLKWFLVGELVTTQIKATKVPSLLCVFLPWYS